MPEPVPVAVRRRLQDMAVDRQAKGCRDLAVGSVGDGDQQPFVDIPPDHGGPAQDARVSRRRAARVARGAYPAAIGEGRRASRSSAASSSTWNGLPSASDTIRSRLVAVRGRPEDRTELVPDIGAPERFERDVGGDTAALQLGQDGPQRVATRDLVRPIGEDDQDRGRRPVASPGSSAARGSIGRPSGGHRPRRRHRTRARRRPAGHGWRRRSDLVRTSGDRRRRRRRARLEGPAGRCSRPAWRRARRGRRGCRGSARMGGRRRPGRGTRREPSAPVDRRRARATTDRANSSSNRVLPIPASPWTRTIRRGSRPSPARAARSASSCRRRPMNAGLETRPGMGRIITQGCLTE